MDKTASGLFNGMLGMLIFSGSLPATRVGSGVLAISRTVPPIDPEP